MRISKASFELIVTEEVSSKARYETHYRRPEWPGEQSGATIGIGYDLGQTAASTIEGDWRGRLPDAMVDLMKTASGHTGAAGKTKTAQIRNSIDVPWDVAVKVHETRVLPRWEKTVDDSLPNTELLSGDSFGALVSLTFNRGPQFAKEGDRSREMRNIKTHMATKNFAAIPAEIRSMKRLWDPKSGLINRRETEARLFERGLVDARPAKQYPVMEVLTPGEQHDDVIKVKEIVMAEMSRFPDVYDVVTQAAVAAIQRRALVKDDSIVGNKETWPILLDMEEEMKK